MQFKRLLSSSYILNTRNKFWIAPFFVIGAIASCAVSDDNNDGEPTSLSKAVKFLTGEDAGKAILGANGKSTMMSFSSNFCEEPNDEKRTIEFSIETSFGKKRASFVFRPDRNEISELFVDSKSQGFIDEQLFSEVNQEISNLCKLEEDRIGYERATPFLNTFTKTLNDISPFCNMESVDNTFTCKLGNQSLASLSNELKQINQNILKRVKRPPYILMRKLSFSRQLSKAISSGELAGICSLTNFSLKEETPIAMKTSAWTDGVCNSNDQNSSKRLAIETLRLAKNEVRTLESLALKSSARGIVSIRLPKTLTKGHRTLFVELSPSSKVYKEITSSSIFANLPSDTGFCWHPIASDNSEAGQSLFSLGFLKSDQNLCAHSAEGLSNGIKELAASITGDASFVVSNYRGKLLRLPRGDYDYQISTLPSDPRAVPLDSGTVIKTGTLSWSGRRYTTIK